MTGWLTGWPYRQQLTVSGTVGAGTNYQVQVTVNFGNGDGGIYCWGHAKPDFSDARFTAADGTTLLSIWQKSVTNNVSATFYVKVAASLETAETIYFYYGNPAAASVSSQTSTFVDVVGGVVGAWSLEEADTEVNPIVIADDNQTAFWSPTDSAILSNDTTTPYSGTDRLKVVFLNQIQYGGFWHGYGSNQDWSAKSLFRFAFFGANSGGSFRVKICMSGTDANYYYYSWTDNFVGLHLFSIPFSSMNSGGTVNLAQVTKIVVYNYAATPLSGTWYFDRWVVDVGVPAVDYSGNGNTGTATGTTVVAGRFAGKNARQYNGVGDFITIPDSASLHYGNNFSYFVRVKKADAVRETIIGSENGVSMPQLEVQYNSGHPIVQVIYSGTVVFNNDFAAGGFIPIDSNWHTIGISRNGTANAIFVDSVSQSLNTNLPNQFANTNITVLGRRAVGSQQWNGLLNGVIIFNAALSASQFASMNANYPDVSLQAGSVLIRKYVYPEPTVTTWSGEQQPSPVNSAGTNRIRTRKPKSKLTPELTLTIKHYLEFKKQQREAYAS